MMPFKSTLRQDLKQLLAASEETAAQQLQKDYGLSMYLTCLLSGSGGTSRGVELRSEQPQWELHQAEPWFQPL